MFVLYSFKDCVPIPSLCSFRIAIQLSNIAQTKGIEHSKIPKLLEIVSSSKDKVLIFTSYRDSVNVINEKLNSIGVKSEILIGKAGETGLKQKKQIETVQRFRDGQTKVLVATRVGEEGLDISEVNLVIFYEMFQVQLDLFREGAELEERRLDD